MIARLLHGFTDRLPALRCCGRRWNDLPRHRSFAHGEEVVIPEQELDEWELQWPFPLEPEPPLTCFCGAPAVGYDFDLMGDGQVTNRQARCVEHLVGLP